jgi:amidohydrolase
MKRRLVSLMVALSATVTAHAAITPDQLDQMSSAVQPQVVEWRRWFHQNPELSNREFNTSKRLVEILAEMGLKARAGIANTGVVAIIEGGRPGPLVAIRADIDGLPVTEKTGLPFASTARGEYLGNEVGVMHACGHDSHMAMALGAAKILNDIRADLPGSVMIIFQPAEEGPPPGEEGGASLMLDEGIFDGNKPEAVFGLHVGISIPGGQMALKPGPMMAASDRFTVTVSGKQTHGARPWDGVDPVVVASQIVMALQTIPSRQVDVTLAPSIVTVGTINGGVRYNVIPDTVEMAGTIRTFDQEMREYIHQAIGRTARAIAESAGAKAEVDVQAGPPALVNNAELVARMMPVLQRVSGELPVLTVQPQTVAEDFSEFANVTPGLYLFLGNGEPGVSPAGQPTNHSPLFNVYEPSMETGVRVFTHMVVEYLQGAGSSD